MDYENGKTSKFELIYKVREMVDSADTMLSVADRLGANPGVVWRVYHGGDSPQLRRKLGIRKGNRVRLAIDTDRATIARFDDLRGEMTRGDFLVALLDWHEYEGDIPY